MESRHPGGTETRMFEAMLSIYIRDRFENDLFPRKLVGGNEGGMVNEHGRTNIKTAVSN